MMDCRKIIYLPISTFISCYLSMLGMRPAFWLLSFIRSSCSSDQKKFEPYIILALIYFTATTFEYVLYLICDTPENSVYITQEFVDLWCHLMLLIVFMCSSPSTTCPVTSIRVQQLVGSASRLWIEAQPAHMVPFLVQRIEFLLHASDARSHALRVVQ